MNPVSLRSLSPTEAESLSLIARHASGIALAGVAAGLSVRPLASAPPAATEDDALLIQLQWSGAQFLFVVSVPNVLVLLRRLCAGAPMDGLAPGWQAALDHLLPAWIADAAERLGRGRPDLLALRRVPGGASLPRLAHALELSMDLDGHGVINAQAQLHVDALGLHLIAGLCGALPPAPAPVNVEALPHRLWLVAGTTWLPLARVKSLKAGQLLFVEQSHLTPDEHFWLSLGVIDGRERGFVARYDDLAITLLRGPMESMMQTPEGAMQADSELQDGNDMEPVALDQLPVALSFDCGSVTLPLAEVAQLAPGQVIPTQKSVNDYVSIRANGAVIGRGVLMQVDGRLAVSITQMSSASADLKGIA